MSDAFSKSGVRFQGLSRSAFGRDLAEVLPASSLAPALSAAAAVIALFGLLDLVHYWPL